LPTGRGAQKNTDWTELGWSERHVGDYVTTRNATNPHLLTAISISKSIGMLFPVSGAD